jgi:hypothetical protein
MGSFLSRGPAVEATEAQELKKQEAEQQLKKQFKSQHDGRTYKEVLCAGEETNAMSQLHESGPSWKFCEAPEDEKVCLP